MEKIWAWIIVIGGFLVFAYIYVQFGIFVDKHMTLLSIVLVVGVCIYFVRSYFRQDK